ncbi:3-dehydrosphinganine reductase-like [Watersipora subatra]|uniref:3-dehydrosphinganine reductase-like n=1 Tax=Watersipora subatra TaxID=2589382 RepID=UPI00355C4A44
MEGIQILLCCGAGLAVVLLLLPFIILHILTKRSSGTRFEGKHVLITGGSQGIGLELAKQCAANGSHVTILARNLEQLQKALELIEKCRKYPDSQMVQIAQCDLSLGYDNVEQAIRKAESAIGENVQVLINSAGYSVNKYFEDFTVDQFKKMMDVNYFGALFTTKAVLDNMKVRKSGSIVFLSSQGAQVGFIGMTCYSPTKYALKGLAECLHNELLPFNINVAVVYPSDTDTPGFANENIGKAVECKEISSTSSLVQPEKVASQILSDLKRGRFSICIGLDGIMLNTVTCGMLPYECFSQAFVQVYLIGIFRLIGMFYATFFQSIIMKHKEKRKLY